GTAARRKSMRWNSMQSVCLNGLAAAALLGGAAVSGQAKDKQVGLVYDQAQVAPDVMRAAQNQGSRIFREAVVAAQWVNCWVVVERGELNDSCGKYYDASPIFIYIRPTAGDFPNEQAMAHAVVVEGGVRATVFFDRVQGFVEKNHPSCGLGRLIGHVMA